VEATSQDGAVTLTWEGVSEAGAYRVYRATSATSGVSGAPLRDGLSESSFTDASVENGTQYYYRVTAVGEGGESDPSSEVTVRPFPGPPDRPEE
jgi:fibronectin type 3 domain-containing protein